jgi:glutamine synthetase
MDTDTQAIKDWLKQHQISEVECLVPDITGNARGGSSSSPPTRT